MLQAVPMPAVDFSALRMGTCSCRPNLLPSCRRMGSFRFMRRRWWARVERNRRPAILPKRADSVAFGDLTTLADVKAWLQTGQAAFPATDDALLTRLVTAARSEER